MSELKVTEANFEKEVLSSEKPVLLDFWAVWCGPCKMIAPLLGELAALHPEITVGKVNVDEEPQLAIRYGVMSIPTLILIQEGKEVRRLVGLQNMDTLQKFVLA